MYVQLCTLLLLKLLKLRNGVYEPRLITFRGRLSREPLNANVIVLFITKNQESRMAADEPSPRPLKRLPTKLLASRVQEPIFESYMFKQSHILNGFNKRYFVLFPGYLVYYTSEHDYKVDHQKGNLAVSILPAYMTLYSAPYHLYSTGMVR